MIESAEGDLAIFPVADDQGAGQLHGVRRSMRGPLSSSHSRATTSGPGSTT